MSWSLREECAGASGSPWTFRDIHVHRKCACPRRATPYVDRRRRAASVAERTGRPGSSAGETSMILSPRAGQRFLRQATTIVLAACVAAAPGCRANSVGVPPPPQADAFFDDV